MRCKIPAILLCSFIAIGFLGLLSLHLSHVGVLNNSNHDHHNHNHNHNHNNNRHDNQHNNNHNQDHPFISHRRMKSTSSILLPDWVVLVIVDNQNDSLSIETNGDYYSCVFPNNIISPARFSGVLPSTNRTTFKCVLPNSLRQTRPFYMPALRPKSSLPEIRNNVQTTTDELIAWNFVVYDSYSTKDDVVVFAKGVNKHQTEFLKPASLMCVFSNGVKTAVSSSSQEVFRCGHPSLTTEHQQPIKVTLEIDGATLVPSVAYYRKPILSEEEEKSHLCASTMVYNSAKFLKEWVMYYSKIGVKKFILYDNDSDDDLKGVVEDLVGDGYDVKTLFWVWPKAQEAGFSHSTLYAKDSCTWMMYVDIDEFVFSPSWLKSSQPAPDMLQTLLLPNSKFPGPIGQVSINCHDFGPSNQSSNPVNGVTQGYTCRRIFKQRHKSIVLLDAVDISLKNAIHHFELKDGYQWKSVQLQEGIVNHYKYQAWTEFKNKFRRRVSAYVADWTQAINPSSNDRTPGLGYEAVEPEDWANKFCEATDNRLQLLTQQWFADFSTTDLQMAWQK